MGDIEVDPAALQRVARQLTEGAGVAHEVQKHHKRLASHARQAGHPAVVAGAASFLDRWSYGCGCLLSDATGIATALGRAGAIYLQTDNAVARAASDER